MRVPGLVLAVILVTAPGASALGLLALDSPTGGEVIVGYREGALPDTLRLLASLGATVLGKNEDLRYVVAHTRDATHLLATVLLASYVEYSERNDRTQLHGAQWNGAQWNGAQWNGAQWNGAQWNGNTSGEPGQEWQWGLDAIRAPAAWATSTGERRAELCVLDSGVAWDHPDLAANMWTGPTGERGFNAIDPTKSAYDDAGHGTHMAGIAAAVVGNAHGTAGVGNVVVVPVKVLDANGTGHEDDLAAGITWCANRGVEVALMALGIDTEGPTVKRALEYARSRDVLLVASAGNAGCSSCIGLPARHDAVVAVGALGKDMSVAPFSNRGSQLDLAAPGVSILAPFTDTPYAYGSGTSQAAAFAAGAAALVRDAHPDLSAMQTRARLESTARDLGAAGPDSATGRGAIDVRAAIEG